MTGRSFPALAASVRSITTISSSEERVLQAIDTWLATPTP
jgi:hypothetical protein